MNESELSYIKKLIDEIIIELNLNLKNKIILTEVASNYYMFTPIIASLANAKKVIAYAKDSKYGRAEYIKKQANKIVTEFDCPDNISIVTEIKNENIDEADIITNLGNLRPINMDFIDRLKEDAVISLMYETWELRDDDLDLSHCWKRQIPVLGVNEEDERINILDYLGDLAMKKLGLINMVKKNPHIVVLGTDKFGVKIFTKLKKKIQNIDIITIENAHDLLDRARPVNVIILCNHSERNKIVFNKSFLKTMTTQKIKPAFIQIAGGLIDVESAVELGFIALPENEVKPGYMGWNLSELGPEPVIKLNAAGLKVGEVLSNKMTDSKELNKAVSEAVNSENICQDFSREQKIRYKMVE